MQKRPQLEKRPQLIQKRPQFIHKGVTKFMPQKRRKMRFFNAKDASTEAKQEQNTYDPDVDPKTGFNSETGAYQKEKSGLKRDAATVWWTIKTAWEIKKLPLIFWMSITIFISVMPALMLLVTRRLIDNVVSYIGADFEPMAVILQIALLGLIFVLQGLMYNMDSEILAYIMYNTYSITMCQKFMYKVRSIPLRFYDKSGFHDEFYVAYAAMNKVGYFMGSLCSFTGSVIGAVSLIIVAFGVSQLLFAVCLVYIAVVLFFGLRQSIKNAQDDQEDQPKHRLLEYFDGIPQNSSYAKEMRVYHNYEFWKKLYYDLSDYLKDRLIKRSSKWVVKGTVLSTIYYCFVFAVMLIALFDLRSGLITIGVFTMLFSLTQSLSTMVSNINRAAMDLYYNIEPLYAQKYFLANDYSDAPISEERKKAHYDNPSSDEYIFELRNVSYKYSKDSYALKNVTLKIKKGETVALVGVNGSGKSTLIKTILGLYEPNEGELFIFGKPFFECTRDDYRKKTGVFFQDCMNTYQATRDYAASGFHQPIRECVGYGDVENMGDEEAVLRAIKKGGAEKILARAPKGLDTYLNNFVEKDGLILSGGEAQKIGVSRTHMGDKEVLILDEPAAMLDPIAEMEQFMTIRNLTRGRSAVLISHRVGFARLADRIIVLDGGRVIEDGTHEELVAINGTYADFFREQAKWYENPQGREDEGNGRN